MSQSAVSRQVSALEKDLGVALFHRHARGLVLTEQGELLFRTATDVMNKLQTAETLLADTTTKPAGDLRITAPVGLGTVWVTQRLREFMELYPDIRVELILNDEQIDISMREADVAIWTREPEQSRSDPPPAVHHAGARLRLDQLHQAASARRSSLDRLDKHRFVSYGGTSAAAPLRHRAGSRPPAATASAPRVPAFRANSVLAHQVRDPRRHRHRPIPDYLTEEETDLVPVLERGRAADACRSSSSIRRS